MTRTHSGASGFDAMGMTQALRAASANTPQKVATRYADRVQTWAELRQSVERLAGALQGYGLRSGDRAAILALNSDRYSEFLFAAWWAGGVVVPMNVRWSAAENAYSLNDAGAEILFIDQAFAPMLPAFRETVPNLKHVIYLDDGAPPAGAVSYSDLIAGSAPIDDMRRAGEDLGGLYYTGGTTGFPKGVMVPQRALWFNSLVIPTLVPIEADSVDLHAAPMFHMADSALSGAASAMGAEHVFIPSFTPAGVVEAIHRHNVTHTVLVPTMIAMVLQDPSFDPDKLSTLEVVAYGGSPMPEGVMRDALTKLPNVKFFQAYGQTELAPMATYLPASYHKLDGPKSTKLRSAGRAVPGVEIRVVDDNGADVADGQVGEIAVAGPGVMHGYWNKPEQTDVALRDGWVFTGDGGYKDEDGFFFIVDRLKDMIVTGGENVFSVEVESAISTHPAVAQVAVIGIPAEKWGEAVHAIVVPRDGHVVTEAEIIDHCRQNIANYKLPRSVDFRSDPMPLSGAGKILKRDLRAPYWEGADRNVN
ncbi:MAG: long-chain-fatty-acid--CoA ligase [Pseudomonadota bacterium]